MKTNDIIFGLSSKKRGQTLQERYIFVISSERPQKQKMAGRNRQTAERRAKHI